MRKRIMSDHAPLVAATAQPWIDVEDLAQVELSSEDANHPIESALRWGAEPGWLAAAPGQQTIRLLFDEPLHVRQIHLAFQEAQHGRTQEFTLRWSRDGGQSYQEIVRQQYTFSPSGTTQELEEYNVDLHGVNVLALQITPDISGGPALASLAGWYLRAA